MTIMLCAQAKASKKRDKRIDAVFQKFPELNSIPLTDETFEFDGHQFPLATYSFICWEQEGDQTIIEIEMRDHSKVSALAAELTACGCDVAINPEAASPGNSAGLPS